MVYTDKKTGKFTKGNPGRPKGAKDKKTKMWDELGEFVVNEGAQTYMKYLKQMDPEDYMKRFEAVLEYFQPKLARLEQTGDMVLHHKPILGGNSVSGDNSAKKAIKAKKED